MKNRKLKKNVVLFLVLLLVFVITFFVVYSKTLITVYENAKLVEKSDVMYDNEIVYLLEFEIENKIKLIECEKNDYEKLSLFSHYTLNTKKKLNQEILKNFKIGKGNYENT